MDEQRFDNLTRLFGSGLNRRKVLRGLLGGAGALAVAGTSRQMASADEHCEARVNCVNVRAPECTVDVCPAGSLSGNNRGTAGTCCTGEGTCCSGNCVNGVCDGPPPPECTTNGDCAACEVCDSGTCIPTGEEYCEAGDYCYTPGTGGCCDSTECGCGECVQGQCTNPECCFDDECGACQECEGNICVDLANCCTNDDDCDPGETCVNGECVIEVCFERVDCTNVQQPACPDLCPAGSFPGNNRALDGVCCTGNGTCCSNNCVNGVCVGGTPPECEYDSDCDGDCEICYQGYCSGACNQSQECCYDVCVPLGTCCKDFGEYCGVLDVTPAGGAVQLDCCDGLLCCHAKHGNVCAECCDDHNCPKGAYCHNGWCEWPDEECDHDKDCPHGTCCCKDGSCSKKCCDHHHPKPHPKPKPPKPAPDKPVTTLPATGAGPSDEKNGLLGATALGAAAALYAAKKMRETPEVSTEE